MKMKPQLWRVVSVWLCVTVFCWCCSRYVGCTESLKEAQRPVSSQDVGPEEESGEKGRHHKIEENGVLPAHALSENEQFIERHWQIEEQEIEDVNEDQNQNIEFIHQAFEAEEPAGEEKLETDEGISQPEPEHEQSSENPHADTSITADEDSASLPPSSQPASEFAADLDDDSNLPNPQDTIPDRVSYDAAQPKVIGSDLPPAHCEEEENNPFDGDSGPPIVLENTANVHTAGTKTEGDSPTGHGTKHLDANASYVPQEKDTRSPVTKGPDSSASPKDPEDIPTFDEWTRKMMEVENEKTQSTHTSNNVAPPSVKKVQKNFNNYASVECGAKILGSNPEAKSTSAILMENMDVYMLNPCSNKIWFIIELCEPIQVKQLDIANFELFSSTPKDFLVSISDRYPTNKWLKLGTFHGRDERTVQSFPLDEHLYAKYVKMFTKYIKVELLSHFGSEHFCPLSLIRVFGTSMVEEYEEIADHAERPDDQDDDLDYPPGYAPGEDKLSNDLIGSAKDVILNMVNNIAINVLGTGSDIQGNLSSQGVNVTEPSAQLETSSPTADPSLVSDSEVEETFPDPSILANVAPSPETSASEISTADTSKPELPQVEENIVIPLENEEEKSIGSTITLLDKDEFDEEKQNGDQHEQRLHIQKCCPQLTSLPSTCSCAASLQEYLRRQCSPLLSKKKECQATKRKQVVVPTLTPTCHISLSPSACPGHRQHYSEVHHPHDQEQASEQETESEARPSETPPPPPGSPVEPHKESRSEPPLLEPSQTSNLPPPSATDSSSAKPAPIVETPQLSAEEPKPEKSQDVLAEDAHVEPSASLSSSIYVDPGVSAAGDDAAVAPKEETPDTDVSRQEIKAPDKTSEYPSALHPTATSPQSERHPDPPAVAESSTASPEVPPADPDASTELEPAGGPSPVTETKTEDFAEDGSAAAGGGGGKPSSPLSDVYAEAPDGTEPNGNTVHGSSQKESVFMRLNNRIKALEMNMSLSGRYLEQLSQRYRKQMEEMQKAFNKTIIKLQNTSTIAEEQDQRQTESIQLLQGQLENLTQLVVNLSVRVSQLQDEVSDRQNYLLLSLALCLCLGLLLCANHCRIPTGPPTTEPEPPTPKSYTYCCPERHFTSCEETGLKRRASYPEGPEMLQAEETQSLCAANRKRRRRKMKANEKVETLKPSFHGAPELCNGAVLCNGVSVPTNAAPLAKRLLQPLFRDSPSEGSSEGSSHSDDPSFCGITTACNRICDGLPRPKTRAEKRAFGRRRPKPSCAGSDLLQVPRRDRSEPVHISTIQDIMNRKNEAGSGTFGVNVVLSGPV